MRMMMPIQRIKLLVVAAALTCGATGAAQATGKVEAIADDVTDLQIGPLAQMASASDGGMSASTSRTRSDVAGAIIDVSSSSQRTPADTDTSSDFEVFGVNGTVPLTFHWTFTGGRTWNENNTSFGIAMRANLVASGFNDTISWSISYIDSAPQIGNFAGELENPFRVNAAGAGYANVLPAGDWDGMGSREVQATLLSAFDGKTGSFGQSMDMGMSGDVTAAHSITLRAVTVADASQIRAGAHLLLDDDSQVMISAIPEPEAWALLLVGLAVVGVRLRKRQTFESANDPLRRFT